jgi:putative drug exporter of the RND superfamily
MAGVLYRLGRLCANRGLVVVAVWLGLVVGVQLVVGFAWAETSNDLRLPGTESQQATDLLSSRFPPQQNGSSPFVFQVAKGKITDTANKKAVESAYKALTKAPHVASALDPFANAASGLVSKDATTAFTPVLLDIPAATGDGVTAYVGGVTAANVDLAGKISSQLVELILVVLALGIVLLLIAFRSLLIPLQAVVTNLLCVGPPSACSWPPSSGAGACTWSAFRPRTAACPSPATCP